jgi:hypothetical protein
MLQSLPAHGDKSGIVIDRFVVDAIVRESLSISGRLITFFIIL